jgi:hypothetical protein
MFQLSQMPIYKKSLVVKNIWLNTWDSPQYYSRNKINILF